MKLQELQDRISEWSSSLGGSLEGKLEHLLEEVRDLQRNPYDIEAQVDVYILMCAISAETGFNIDEITQGIDSKQNINEAKEWNPPDAQGITRYKKTL